MSDTWEGNRAEQTCVIFNGACVCLVSVSEEKEQVSGFFSPCLMWDGHSASPSEFSGL